MSNSEFKEDSEVDIQSLEEILGEDEYQWRKENREKGERLEDITEKALERMKQRGIIRDFKRFPNESRPDFIVDGEIGIECKNRDPEKKNIFSTYNVITQITDKFEGRDWSKKVLIISQLMLYPTGEEESMELLRDYKIVEIGSFVTEDNKAEMEEKLFELMIRLFSD